MKQTAALETKRKELQGAQTAIAQAQEAVEEYERKARRSARKGLPGATIPDDHPVRRRLAKIDWEMETTKKNHKGEPYFGTPAVNAAVAFDILNDDRYTPEEKVKYGNVLLGTALEQQDRGETRSGKLFEDSHICRTETGATVPNAVKSQKVHTTAAKHPKADGHDAMSKMGSILTTVQCRNESLTVSFFGTLAEVQTPKPAYVMNICRDKKPSNFI